MPKATTAMKKVEFLDLSLKNIFPFNDLSDCEDDDSQKINEAYKKLFVELIPGFDQNHVQFVLAEVLEIDRKESASRLLVYSGLNEAERDKLIKEYKDILSSLKDVSRILISESDAFYRTSRIWCAQTRGGTHSDENITTREWSFLRESITAPGMSLNRDVDLVAQEEAITKTFRFYVQELHAHYLKSYPYAYVLLVPIFLNSMSGKPESLQKLGAVFLHFTSTRRVEEIELRRIYGRTLLFWHYYFTSEAIDRRQRIIQEQEARDRIYSKIEPHLDDIRKGLLEIREPLRRLEAELNPVGGLLVGGEDVTSEFFSVTGRRVILREGLPEITPRHDWKDGDIEPYKRIVAGLLIKILQIESQIRDGEDLWEGVCRILTNSEKPVFLELLNSFPDLRSQCPDKEQVKRTFSGIKSWFSDSHKREIAPGLPLDFVEFALRVWEADVVIEKKELTHFWVASRSPAQTISALEMINAMYRIRQATIAVSRSRSQLSNASLSSCELRLTLSPTHGKRGSLFRLSKSLSKALTENETPRGDMTRFLWEMGGRRPLTLRGTRFIGYDKQKEGEISIDFKQRTGPPQKLLVTWHGRIYT